MEEARRVLGLQEGDDGMGVFARPASFSTVPPQTGDVGGLADWLKQQQARANADAAGMPAPRQAFGIPQQKDNRDQKDPDRDDEKRQQFNQRQFEYLYRGDPAQNFGVPGFEGNIPAFQAGIDDIGGDFGAAADDAGLGVIEAYLRAQRERQTGQRDQSRAESSGLAAPQKKT